MSWIITKFGHAISIESPNVDEIDLRDIIHVLSHSNRYNHHTGRFYSTAEHSLIVAMNLAPEYRLEGLLHDAAETYISDIPGPVKKLTAIVDYLTRLEHHLLSCIYEVMGVDYSELSYIAVREADRRIVVNEQRTFFPVSPPGWIWHHNKEPKLRPLPFFPYQNLSPSEAAKQFTQALAACGCRGADALL